jgi:hypothetical protein
LELLKELLPDVSRAAILWNAANPYAADVFRETDRAARTLRITLQSLEVRSPDDFHTAFEAAKVQRPEGLITVEDPLTDVIENRLSTSQREIACLPSTAFENLWRRGPPRLWREPIGFVPARCDLRRQDPEGHQACGSSSSTANQVRVYCQSQRCQGARADHAAIAARPRRRGDRMRA